MEDEKRVTVRLSGPLYRVLSREAAQAGVNFSEYLRRLMLDAKPHLAAFDEVGRIMTAGKDVEAVEAYLPYLVNMQRRLEAELEALNTFDAKAAGWKQEAEQELKTALVQVHERITTCAGGAEMVRSLGKLFAQEGDDV
jgi:hypothetical protein